MRGQRLCLLSISAACALASSSARADDPVATCASIYEEAQILHQQGKYVEAAKRGAVCAKPGCGSLVSAECSKLYDSIQADMPTIVLGARDADQNDLTDVKVYVDGVLVREKLNGSPVPIDPGTHVFRFEAPHLPVVQRSYAVRAGEKLRLLSETLGSKPKDEPLKNSALTEPPPLISPATLRIGGIVTGSVGVAALVGFGVFRWLGYKDYNHLTETCVNRCNQSDVDGISRNFLASNVLLGVGIAASATAATMLLWNVGKTKTTTTHVGVAPQVGGGFVSVGGQF